MAAYFVVVTHDSAFELGGVNPGYEVLHMSADADKYTRLVRHSVVHNRPCDKKSRVGDGIRANSDMSLFNKLYSLNRSENLRRRNGIVSIERLTALTVSVIWAAHTTTARRRLQKAATVNLLSTSESFAVVLSTPKS